MSYKVIALDIDGTLTNDDKIITPRTKAALIKAQQSGKTVVLASGRHPLGVLPYARELRLAEYGGFILCFNGAIAARVTDKGYETVYSREFPNEYIPRVCEIVKKSSLTVNTFTGDTIIADKKVNSYTHIEPDVIGLPFKQVEDFPGYVDFPVNKLLLAGEPGEIDRYEKTLKYYLDGLAGVYKSAPFFLEIVPLGVSKGAGLALYLESAGLTRQSLIACGDSYNDITMIGYAGLGAAMENAEPEVKRIADVITLSNNNDGVGEIVEKYMLA